MNAFPKNVKILSTERFIKGGSSSGPFENFNLAFHDKEELVNVKKNRLMLRSIYGLPSDPVWINQIHSNISISAENAFHSTYIVPIFPCQKGPI